MNVKATVVAVATALLLSGCYSIPSYRDAPVPLKDVGTRADDGWQPYAPAPSAERQNREWQPRNPDWGSDRSGRWNDGVRKEALPPVSQVEADRDRPRSVQGKDASADTPARPSSTDDAFKRAEPKDPPSDPARRRNYSSRPAANAALNAGDQSAFSRPSQSGEPRVLEQKRRSGVRSEWADKAVRDDNRAAFDAMVRDSSRRGEGNFEDEAGRIYYGERQGVDGNCTVVEVTVTTNGGLPVVSRGLAYDCR